VKVFLDTNVLVSAFLSEKNVCYELLDTILALKCFVTGEVVLTELERVLNRKTRVPSAEIQTFIAVIRNLEILPHPKTISPIPVRDEDDASVLASALEAKADYLVTGDKDLLTLGNSAGIKIVDPRTLLDLLEKD
jgi:uncharacterized protein